MDKYIELNFTAPAALQEVLIALLANCGYEGFEETENILKAFIPETHFKKEEADNLAQLLSVTYTFRLIPWQNWNNVWESSFQPVVIKNTVAIRAQFHKPINHVPFEIVITPKMSFGTGHHATTETMLEFMLDLNFNGKQVLDFGTGTGILSILAEKKGAQRIVALDNDECSIANARENIQNNRCSRIQLLQQNHAHLPNEKFDIILSNIHKVVILENLTFLAKQLKPNGYLLLSGLQLNDEESVRQALCLQKLFIIKMVEKYSWLSFLAKS